jgi:hypothetical protein
MKPGNNADREMRIDYAPWPIGGQGHFSRADDQFKVYNSFNSQPFPRILASLSLPLAPLQHAYKVCNALAKSREESRSACEEFLIADGPSSVLHWRENCFPEGRARTPNPGAVSLNRRVLMVVKGLYNPKMKLPEADQLYRLPIEYLCNMQ